MGQRAVRHPRAPETHYDFRVGALAMSTLGLLVVDDPALS